MLVVGAFEFPTQSSVLYMHALLVVAALINVLVLYPNKSFILWRKELAA